MIVTTEDVLTLHTDPTFRLFDVRKPPRYRGEMEPMDPVAGHIPGAVSAPFDDNLGEDGRFKPAERLREHYQALLGDLPAERTAFYCGSGGSSAHSVLAMLHAGLGEGRLYVGSWSEWVTDQTRPVETGG
jgi:thiosulfate/3-mercaptopyruvate sulfurtransferase